MQARKHYWDAPLEFPPSSSKAEREEKEREKEKNNLQQPQKNFRGLRATPR